MLNKYHSGMELLRILKIAGFAASFLRDAGVRIYHPIGIALTEVAGLDVLIRDLPVFSHELVSLNEDSGRFKEKLSQYHDDVVLLHYADGEKAVANLSFIFESTMAGTINSRPFCALPLLIFDGFIPDGIADHLSLILEFGSTKLRYYSLYDSGAEDRFYEGLAEKICQNQGAFRKAVQKSWTQISDLTEAAKLLLSGKAIMELSMALEGVNDEKIKNITDYLQNNIEEALEFTETYTAKDQTVKSFLRALRHLVIQKKYVLFPIDQGFEHSEDILYDNDFYYIPNAIFGEICNHTKFTSPTRIKRCLLEYGIIKIEGHNRRYYSQKVYWGGLQGKRYYQLDRNKVDVSTSLFLAECQ